MSSGSNVRSLPRLQRLQGKPVHVVGRGHIGLFEPAGIARHVGMGLERQGAHVVHEDRHTLLGHGGAEGVHGLERRVELHQPVEILRRPGDTRVFCRFLQRGGRDGAGGLPLEERPGPPVEPEQYGEQAGSCAGQSDDDPGALNAALTTSGCFFDESWSSMRLASARASILETRRRPNVVSSASSSQARNRPQGLPVGVGTEVIRPSQFDRGSSHRRWAEGGKLGPKHASWAPVIKVSGAVGCATPSRARCTRPCSSVPHHRTSTTVRPTERRGLVGRAHGTASSMVTHRPMAARIFAGGGHG